MEAKSRTTETQRQFLRIRDTLTTCRVMGSWVWTMVDLLPANYTPRELFKSKKIYIVSKPWKIANSRRIRLGSFQKQAQASRVTFKLIGQLQIVYHASKLITGEVGFLGLLEDTKASKAHTGGFCLGPLLCPWHTTELHASVCVSKQSQGSKQ